MATPNWDALDPIPELQPLPTFDQWHHTKYMMTFEERWANHLYGAAVEQLSRDLRDYTTEMVRLSLRP